MSGMKPRRRKTLGRLVATAAVAILLGPASAAELDAVVARGELVWAADQEGGGPHVFLDPDAPGRLTGFEVELAELLAAELGVKARFQRGSGTACRCSSAAPSTA